MKPYSKPLVLDSFRATRFGGKKSTLLSIAHAALLWEWRRPATPVQRALQTYLKAETGVMFDIR